MQTPHVGIFWLVDGEIVAFATPVDRGERDGGFVNYSHGHVDLWRFVQRSRPQLREVEYEEISRGRVVLDEGGKSFHLLLPSAACQDAALVDRLIARFGLGNSEVKVIADRHYDPPLGRRPPGQYGSAAALHERRGVSRGQGDHTGAISAGAPARVADDRSVTCRGTGRGEID